MGLVDHLQLMAAYNQWMNEKVYAAAAQLTEAQLKQDRQAFFPSIFATLMHLLVADSIWLRRFANDPQLSSTLADILPRLAQPSRLDQQLFDSFADMRHYRTSLDSHIINWMNKLSDTDVDRPFSYSNMKGVVSTKNLYLVLGHFFNHQTHHRGQATTLLMQAGVDVGLTDLLVITPNIEI